MHRLPFHSNHEGNMLKLDQKRQITTHKILCNNKGVSRLLAHLAYFLLMLLSNRRRVAKARAFELVFENYFLKEILVLEELLCLFGMKMSKADAILMMTILPFNNNNLIILSLKQINYHMQ